MILAMFAIYALCAFRASVGADQGRVAVAGRRGDSRAENI